MKIIATICARGGSKGIPRKNIRLLAGKPLIVHTIEVARKCQLIDRVIVSTDDGEIAEIARKAGAEVPFLRPKELAQDNTNKLLVIKHAVRFLESQEGYRADIIVDLDPTSPLRTDKDIEACVRMVTAGETDNVITVTEARKNPYFNMVEIIDGRVRLVKQLDHPIAGRQGAPKVYDMNASIYVWQRDALMDNETLFLKNTGIYLMPGWAIDIDNETGFEFVELIFKKGMSNARQLRH